MNCERLKGSRNKKSKKQSSEQDKEMEQQLEVVMEASARSYNTRLVRSKYSSELLYCI